MVECIAINRDRLGLVLFHVLWGKSLAESTSHLRRTTSLPKLRIPWRRRHFSDCTRVTLRRKTSSIPLKSHMGTCRSVSTVAPNPSIKSGRSRGNGMSKSVIARVRTFSSKCLGPRSKQIRQKNLLPPVPFRASSSRPGWRVQPDR